jgi:hypothetical protein
MAASCAKNNVDSRVVPEAANRPAPAGAVVDVDRQYEFRVKDRLSAALLASLEALEKVPPPDTVLVGQVRDIGELHGHIARFESLGLELTEVRRLPPRPGTGSAESRGCSLGGPRRIQSQSWP